MILNQQKRMQKSAVTQVNFGRFAQALLDIREEGRQFAKDVSTFQNLKMPLDRLVADTDNLRRFRVVPILTVLVRDDLGQLAPLLAGQMSLSKQR